MEIARSSSEERVMERLLPLLEAVAERRPGEIPLVLVELVELVLLVLVLWEGGAGEWGNWIE